MKTLKVLKKIQPFLLNNPVINFYGKIRHKKLLKTCSRLENHNYTAFYRSPIQLEAIKGPVLDFLLENRKRETISINLFGCSSGAEPYTISSTFLNCGKSLDFKIVASDISPKLVEIAQKGQYREEFVLNNNRTSNLFIQDTFDHYQGKLLVKNAIKDRILFCVLDIMSDDHKPHFKEADLVFAQNILFHLDPDDARKAFKKIYGSLKNKSVLFIDGMDLDIRQEVTKTFNLVPLDFKIREIYEYSRSHVGRRWWKHYWGAEPFSNRKNDYKYRYGTIFLKT